MIRFRRIELHLPRHDPHMLFGQLLSCMLLAFGLLGCAQRSTSPYTPPAELARNSLRAQEFTQRAASIQDSEPEQAEKLLCEALAADLYHGPAHNNLGVLYLNQGMLYEAANEFEWARKLMPGHPDPRMNLAFTLERAGRIEEALASYRTALEVAPHHIATIQALVRCQLRHSRPNERTRDLLKEIALRGESEEWRHWAKEQLVLERF